MAFQTPITIANAITNIRTEKYLLPAIQREFVWSADQIVRLFDSILRGYPINSFLFWKIDNKNRHEFQFYKFLQKYRQYYGTHNPEARVEGLTDIQAVLDGQQRLTSLYIGLTGTYAYKRRRVWWADNEHVLPPRRLFLNISHEADNEDLVYDFQWLIEKNTPLTPDTPFHQDSEGRYWLLVGRILDYPDQGLLDEFLDRHDFGTHTTFTRRTMRRLWAAIHSKPLINYYLEDSQKIDKVVDIFIRTNAGGTRLSFSDLLLSMATAGWKTIDARKEIHNLVDELNRLGFSFDKDFVLKCLLVLFSTNIRFKIENFHTKNIELFEANWPQVRAAITVAVKTAQHLGFTSQTLRSHNALIPVVYYLFHKSYAGEFETAVAYEADRRQIGTYLHIVLLTRLYGRQSDSVLTALRNVLQTDDCEIFPLREIMARCEKIGRSVSYSEEMALGLLRTQMEDSYAFSILALLYPNLAYNYVSYHKDHLHPKAAFSEAQLDNAGILDPEERAFFLDADNNNSILNLQLLSDNKNKQKQDASLKAWVEEYQPDLDAHLIPSDCSLAFADFKQFIEAREKLLLKQLEGIWL